MLTFLLVVQAIVAVLLVGVILMQQSEGGGLGMGGSPTGLMSARGAADFLTRATTVLASVFIGLSILHAVLATRTGSRVSTIDTSLARPKAPVTPLPAPQPNVPLAGQPTAPAGAPSPTPPVALPSTVPLATARPESEPRPNAVVRNRPSSSEPVTPPTVSATIPATPASNSN